MTIAGLWRYGYGDMWPRVEPL